MLLAWVTLEVVVGQTLLCSAWSCLQWQEQCCSWSLFIGTVPHPSPGCTKTLGSGERRAMCEEQLTGACCSSKASCRRSRLPAVALLYQGNQHRRLCYRDPSLVWFSQAQAFGSQCLGMTLCLHSAAPSSLLCLQPNGKQSVEKLGQLFQEPFNRFCALYPTLWLHPCTLFLLLDWAFAVHMPFKQLCCGRAMSSWGHFPLCISERLQLAAHLH